MNKSKTIGLWMGICVCFTTLVVSNCNDQLRSHGGDGVPGMKDIAAGPLNEAEIVGVHVILTCSRTDNESRISWAEYASGAENGQPISDGDYVLPGHPSASRYHIIHDTEHQYDLLINTTFLTDGGKYRCTDIVVVNENRFAQVIMLETDPTCTTTIPSTGDVVDMRYYTIECTVTYQAESNEYAPIMTWTGPGAMDVESITSNTTVWSKIGFTATSSMAGQQFFCKTNFTSNGYTEPDSATNAPIYEHIYSSVPLIVNPSPFIGASYIRWGRTVCQSTADIIYRGYAASTHITDAGGSDHLCLPETPSWGTVFDGFDISGSILYGVEYDVNAAGCPLSFENNDGNSIQGLGAPCVACLTNRSANMMIPGLRECPLGWTTEYRGYAATEKFIDSSSYRPRTGYVCLDDAPEVAEGTGGEDNQGSVFSVVEVSCTSIGAMAPCTNGWELPCVVCTK